MSKAQNWTPDRLIPGPVYGSRETEMVAPLNFHGREFVAVRVGPNVSDAEALRDRLASCYAALSGIPDPEAFVKCFGEMATAIDRLLSDYRTEGCSDRTCGLCQKSKSASDAAHAALTLARSLTTNQEDPNAAE